jgi:hypothetical protein
MRRGRAEVRGGRVAAVEDEIGRAVGRLGAAALVD